MARYSESMIILTTIIESPVRTPASGNNPDVRTKYNAKPVAEMRPM